MCGTCTGLQLRYSVGYSYAYICVGEVSVCIIMVTDKIFWKFVDVMKTNCLSHVHYVLHATLSSSLPSSLPLFLSLSPSPSPSLSVKSPNPQGQSPEVSHCQGTVPPAGGAHSFITPPTLFVGH